jgi:hypothetical protein
MKCGEKWGKGHRCPKQVPMHILEEVLEVMQQGSSSTEEVDTKSISSDDEEELLSLSLSAVQGIQGPKTLKLQGLIQKQEILILVDSGSSSTFISSATATRLQLPQQQAPELLVTIAMDPKWPVTLTYHRWCGGHKVTHSPLQQGC